ncbi:MAG: AI-2E family transporter [Candidatus Peregrinibacteria bacterium]|nr:AI-2E family transporter [Candidatus Peregrinibacteria bacterium]
MEKRSLRKKFHDSTLKISAVPAYFLLACLLIALYYLLILLAPFSTVLIFAAVLATAFHPVYRALRKHVKHDALASFITCILITLLIVVPFIVLVFLLAGEAVNMYILLQHKLSQGFLDPLFQWQHSGPVFDWYTRVFPGFDPTSWDISGQITSFVKDISSLLISQVQGFVTGILGFFVNFLIMLFAMFYFIKDGGIIVKKIMALSPLPEPYEKKLFSRLRTMTNATLYGTFFTAIVQGFLGGIGFALVGISQPVLWGTVMAFFALAPYIGTAFVWVPAVLILLFTGSVGQAVFLFAWSILLVSTIDNFLLPYLIGSSAKTYSLLTFLCVIGGIYVWGFPGLVLGPLVLTLLIAMSEIYEAEYRPLLKQLDHDDL